MSRPRFVDVQIIYHKREPRTLEAAYAFYCNKQLDNAHSAESDTRATYEVLKSQLEHYPDLVNDIDTLSKEYSSFNDNVDLAGRMIYNEDGVEVFNFGKHKGKPVEEVLNNEPSYYAWMMDGDFPLNTKQALTKIRLRGMTG
jgi:DNA polymerase-3 subunit epsilon